VGELAGFQRAAPATVPKGHIAWSAFFPGCFVWTEGVVVNLQKVPGTLVKSSFLNSKTVLLNFVNCVENQRKIRKMQTQFCWIPGENTTNFVILA
jgi:hypothetical protein